MNTSVEKSISGERIQFQLEANKCNLVRIFFVIIAIALVGFSVLATKYSLKRNIFSSNYAITIQSPNKTRVRCIVFTNGNTGRLGNIMFITASAYGLARLHSCHLYFQPDIITKLNIPFIFNLSSLLILPSEFTKIAQSKTNPPKRLQMHIGCRFVVELTRPYAIPNNSIFELHGYWQSYLHFAKYGDDIRELMFTATPSTLQKVAKLFIDIYSAKTNITPTFSLENHASFKRQLARSQSITWIAVHIRRSDFVGLRFSSSDEYVFKAMNYYSSIYSNIRFIVASDDKPYCLKLFQRRTNVFVTPRSFSQSEDMIALSLCQHSIITGGTFGWWAAFLANGQVFHDTVYPSGCERREHYYPPWFLIDDKAGVHNNGNNTL